MTIDQKTGLRLNLATVVFAAGQERIIAHFEEDAADVNNGGFESQFRFLLGGHESLEAGERELHRLIDERARQ
jgi:hypothetical protein